MQQLAERGTNLGGATVGLQRMLDAYGAQELALAVSEALAAGTIHLAAIHQILDRNRHQRHLAPPLALQLPNDQRVRNLVVKPHSLTTYDQLSRTDLTPNGELP